MSYNGWKNYQTWLVVTWGYDEIEDFEYRRIMEDDTITERVRVNRLADALAENFNSSKDDFLVSCQRNFSGVFVDLVTYVTDDIDWHGIAQSLCEDYVDVIAE